MLGEFGDQFGGVGTDRFAVGSVGAGLSVSRASRVDEGGN